MNTAYTTGTPSPDAFALDRFTRRTVARAHTIALLLQTLGGLVAVAGLFAMSRAFDAAGVGSIDAIRDGGAPSASFGDQLAGAVDKMPVLALGLVVVGVGAVTRLLAGGTANEARQRRTG